MADTVNVDYSTKISCSKCGKYLQGRFAQQ